MGNNKSQRIKIDLSENTDKYLKIKLDQDIEQLEFLSLKLKQEDIYNSFNADFGVVVGRVIANDGIGVPNAKLSVFIPISDEDKTRPDIYSIYPYETPRDENNDGKRYNLLPRTSSITKNGVYKPRQPFGSFPSKEEISTNETLLEIYDKYYKFTTITNDSGDYMFFGVPVGLQTIHMSVDITDIGEYSMSPIGMIKNLGYSENLFSSDGFNIKEQKKLEDLPNIETQEISVNVLPFWGDSELFDIGITRQDFNIRAQIKSNIIIFGTIGTMGEPCVIGTPDIGDRRVTSFYYLSNEKDNELNLDIRTLRGSDKLNINIYTYPNHIKEEDIRYDLDNEFDDINDYLNRKKINTKTDIIKLPETEYYYYVNNGFFVLIINCNRDRVITDENGDLTPISEDSNQGVFSRFFGMLLVDYNDNDIELPITQNHDGNTYYGEDKANNTRGRLKIPQINHSLRNVSNDINPTGVEFERYMESEKWKKNFFISSIGKYYSISQFFPTTYINNGWLTNDLSNDNLIYKDSDSTKICKIGGFLFRTSGLDLFNNYNFKYDNINVTGDTVPLIKGGDNPETSGDTMYRTYKYEFPHNKVINRTLKNEDGDTKTIEQTYFGGQWINMFLIIPQFSYTKDYTTYSKKRDMMVAKMLFGDYTSERNSWFLEHRKNEQHVLGDIYTPQNIIRGDTFKTDIIEIPESHLGILNNVETDGIPDSRAVYLQNLIDNGDLPLEAKYYYKYEETHSSGSEQEYNGAYITSNDKGPYIFKGFYENDSIKTLNKLNLI